MSRVAVQIGAGNIGRGFIAQLLHAAGYEVHFIDANQTLVDRLESEREYAIEIAAEPPVKPIQIDNIRAHHVSETDAITDALRTAEIASLSVGANALNAVSQMLAERLLPRVSEVERPLNILVCENPPGQAAALKRAVHDQMPAEHQAAFNAKIGFVDTVIGRMVPVMDHADSLNVRVEPYCELPVDADSVLGELPAIEHLHQEAPFAFWIEQKLFMHNAAHAATAYIGYLNNHEYIHDAIADPAVSGVVRGIMEEVAEALHQKYNASPEQLRAHGQDLIDRFGNRALRDTVERVARDPARKLAPNERFMRAARCCTEFGVPPANLAFAAAAAIRYDHPSDPTAATIQKQLRDRGWDAVLHEVCDVPQGSPLATLIKGYGRNMVQKNDSQS